MLILLRPRGFRKRWWQATLRGSPGARVQTASGRTKEEAIGKLYAAQARSARLVGKMVLEHPELFKTSVITTK